MAVAGERPCTGAQLSVVHAFRPARKALQPGLKPSTTCANVVNATDRGIKTSVAVDSDS
jgi:hypothetical protein